MLTELSQRVLAWYRQNARQLPWRVPPDQDEAAQTAAAHSFSDPYRVWISEVMLQQTQVETVIPYYERWLLRFPTLADLATASEQDVLSLWEGLGYYSRARNLLRAARQVAAQFDGQLPSERQALEKLPGIGRYTAGAIASIAFGKDEAALDGNIRRVLARVFNLSQPARSSEGEKKLWKYAVDNCPPGQAGEYNQALMDLGALICTPHQPDCQLCPLAQQCSARELGVQENRPVTIAHAPVPHFTVTAGIIKRNGLVLIARRPSQGLLGGLWEFPGGKQQPGEDLRACLRRELQEELEIDCEVGELLGVYRHAYTHFKVTLHAFFCRIAAGEPRALQASEIRWEPPSSLDDFPMGKIDRRIAHHLQLR